ncbi:MAG: FtsX-like permease family protein [Rhodospirillales bacterium]
MGATLRLAWTYARRELRGGLKGFGIFLACLSLGVAAIAGVGSLAAAVEAGLKADGRVLLGGDVSFRLTHRPATDEQLRWITDNVDRVSGIVEMRANTFTEDGSAYRLVELKGVDDAYPLFGGLELSGETDLNAALAQRDGAWGAAVQKGLLERLGVGVGDRVRIGDVSVEIRTVIDREPDRGTNAFNFGPRLMINNDALAETGLVQPGSIIRYYYRVDLPDGVTPGQFTERAEAAFPEAGWRIRDLDNAAPNIQRFIDRVGSFMTIVGLTALLVGGVGVGNAVRHFLQGKIATIATLKCLGAPSRLILAMYLVQVGLISLVGIAIGLVFGLASPLLAIDIIGDRLPVAARQGVYWQPILLAAMFGVLVTLVFSLWPLSRARQIPGAALFREQVAPISGFPGWPTLAVVGVFALILAVSAVLTSAQPWLAAGFVLGAIAALGAFALIGFAVVAVSRRLPRPRNAKLRLAIANLHRPGGATGGVIMSLGMGLTVLVGVALLEYNLKTQLDGALRGEIPGYYFIDLQPDQVPTFERIAASFDPPIRTQTVPMLRGRVSAMKGVPASEIVPPPQEAWILRGDRGLTWTAGGPPDPEKIVKGEWWPPDYAGEQLVSFDAEAAEAFDLQIGDTITVNVLGRPITAKVANWRRIDWNDLGINFVMVFSPGVLASAPMTYIATAHLTDEQEIALEKAVVGELPNVSAIRVKEVLEGVTEILANVGVAVRVIAVVAIFAGVLVLAGAIAAGHRKRIYDAVVLKVLGATRRDLITAYALEYGILGLVTAAIASVLGTVAAWFVMTRLMEAPWAFAPEPAIITVIAALVCTVGAGMIGTLAALNKKAAPLLRND